MPTSWASKDNPGLYVFAPHHPRSHWNANAPSQLPRAHYVCRCGQSRAVIGAKEVQALIREYLDHTAGEHPDLPVVPKRQAKRAA
ncbi:hypothetical protein ABH931_000152 [Streptacidiphilus sp. MAP12-33]|uniref:hypothetical protein n=1 Tax=Streptacidiphilus sp. MAP12-33 TaxID=3156266 RepID=UPI003516087E